MSVPSRPSSSKKEDSKTSRSTRERDTSFVHSKQEVVANTLFIGNLARTVREIHILKFFGQYGKIVRETFLWYTSGPKAGFPRGYCFVEFSTHEEALRAQEKAHGQLFYGRPLVVNFASPKVDYDEENPRSLNASQVNARQTDYDMRTRRPSASGTTGGAPQSTKARLLETHARILALRGHISRLKQQTAGTPAPVAPGKVVLTTHAEGSTSSSFTTSSSSSSSSTTSRTERSAPTSSSSSRYSRTRSDHSHTDPYRS